KGWVKLEIACATGKKLHDKRQDLKEKDDKREMDRLLKR
ncbi:MAG: SsrA-binding protein, partial [Crocinitomicaceae bacterium]|nr:SsrA-binding protein [Crocinitomicaceae bacterium]MDP4798955.1 SsrA-binding protein [Crocinitomicaceae bacterium]MDP4867551.1 SsrA-binding protein [Crocinitomicaceae bacterium]